MAVLLTIPLFVFSEPESARAATAVDGFSRPFSISQEYEFSGRTSINATLRMEGEKARYFVDDDYWNARSISERQEILQQINRLADEFDKRIYPIETAFWGSESTLGIDNDPKIVILMANLIDTAGGYYDTVHHFPKSKFPESNAMDMIFLNIRTIRNEKKGFAFLAHEFQHLISFNQKNLLRQTSDDIWLNELRSEYSVILLGYDDIYAESNLKRRTSAFLEEPSDSLTEWANKPADYGQVAVLAEYLTSHYGANILKNSLHSNLSNFSSLNQALRDNGYNVNFADVFLRWAVANALSDVSLGTDYGYFREGLSQELRVPATRAISNLNEGVKIQIVETFKDWQAKWIWFSGIAGGTKNVLKLNLSGEKQDFFRGAAIVFYQNDTREVQFLDFSNPGSEDVFIDFNLGMEKVILIPVKMEKTGAFTDKESFSDLVITAERVAEVPKISGITPQRQGNIGPGTVRPADFGLREGDFIRAEGDNDVYIINDFGFKRLVLSPQICLLYGHLGKRGCFAAVKAVSPQVRDAFKTSYFFTDGESKDGRIYFLEITGDDSAVLRRVNLSGEDFIRQGGNFSAVFLFNTREKNTYPLGAEIENL